MRRHHAAPLLALLSFALVAALQATGVVERLELLTLDARYATGIGRQPAGTDIVIAWIDQDSMDYVDKVGGFPFPWPHEIYQQAQDWLFAGGARAIVYDVLFDQVGNAASDREFAKSLANSRGSVLAMKFMVQRDGGRTPAETARFTERSVAVTGALPVRAAEHGFLLPIGDLEAVANLLGFVNIRPDADKVYRRYDLLRLWTPPGQTTPRAYPSLALAAALAGRRATGIARTPAGAVTLTGAGDSPAVAAGTDARLLLNFRGPEFTFEHVKFVNILTSIDKMANGEPPLYVPERFRDKIVLVGINAEGYEDIHQTPLSQVFPGVELHATALDNILRGDPLCALAWNLPLAAAAVAATTATVFLLPGVVSALLALVLLALLALLATLLCWTHLLVLPVAALCVPAGCRKRLEKLHPDCHHAGPEMAAYRDDHVGGSRLARRNRRCPSGLRHRSRLGGAR